MPIPPLEATGLLPAGIFSATWEELQKSFGTTGHRRYLLRQLKDALIALRKAGCTEVYVDGSFVTNKTTPSDYDMCWSMVGVRHADLDPVLLDFSNGRRTMKRKYGGDIFPAEVPEGRSGKLFRDFFQTDKASGNPKGIIHLSLTDVP